MHRFIAWLGENFVPAWKAVSILFTGAFGILGLVKNFKEKKVDQETGLNTDKITKWGWVSLIGIVLSTGFGVAAQLKETHDNAKVALDLARKSDRTLNNIEKLLSPAIEDPSFDAKFTLLCKEDAEKCKHLWAQRDLLREENWYINVSFFSEQKDAKLYLSGKDIGPDLFYSLRLVCAGFKSHPDELRPDMIMICNPSATPRVLNNGKIRDMIDVRHSVCLIEVDTLEGVPFLTNGGGARVRELSVHMFLKGGIAFAMKDTFAEIKARDGFFYMGSF